MKGNTAEDRENQPSSNHVVTLGMKGPTKITGFTPQATYGNGEKGDVLDLAGKIAKVNASLKAEHWVEYHTSRRVRAATSSSPGWRGTCYSRTRRRSSKSGAMRMMNSCRL